MSNHDFLVSILIPVFNEEKYISSCLESVLSQSHHNIEVILVDDFSTDNTLEVIQSFHDDRIKIEKNNAKGKTSAFNLAYAVSSGDYFVYLGGDDLIPRDSIQTRLSYILETGLEKSQPIAAYGQLVTMSDDPHMDGIKMPAGRSGLKSGGTIMFNRSLAERIFPLPAELPNEDTWTKVCVEKFSCLVIDIPRIVLRYRIHSGNSHSRTMTFEEANLFFHKRYLAYQKFIDRYGAEHNEEVSRLVSAERLRYEGRSFSLLWRIPFWGKQFFSFFVNSSSFLYNMKLKLMRFRRRA